MSAKHSSKNGQKVRYLTPDEGRKLFNRRVRQDLNMSGQEFLEKWDAGEFGDPENPYRPELMRVLMLLPFAQ